MSRKSIFSEEEPETEVNLSPMIDCIFILLIFFIVTTVFVQEKGLHVNKPDAAASVALEENSNVTLEITADNKIMYDHREISLSDVTARVRENASDIETPVVIRTHEKSDHATLVAVWDAAKRGGTQTLSFSTVN